MNEDEIKKVVGDKYYVIRPIEFIGHPKTDKEDEILRRLKRLEKLLQKIKDKKP